MRSLKIIGIITGSLIIIVAACFIILSLWNSSASRTWRANPQEPGKMIDVGDHRLYYTIMGESGTAIIIETDLGSSSPEWWHIQKALAKNFRVLTYDRAGYGWSETAKGGRTGADVVKDLEVLLDKTNFTGPYILIGHGTGALYTAYYAKKNPGAVKSLVMVDPYSVSFYRFKKDLDPVIYSNLINKVPSLKIVTQLARLGIIRLFKATPYAELDASIKQLVVENYSRPALYGAMVDEYREILSKTLEQLAKAGPMPAVPLVVIRHSPELYKKELLAFTLSWDEADSIEAIWDAMYDELAKSTPRGRIVTSTKSTHTIHFDEPELILKAVRDTN